METTKIGNQIWGTNNSIIKTFIDGEKIHHSTSKEDWKECGLIEKPAWCYYDFDERNEKHGLLYNGYVLINSMWEENPRNLVSGDLKVPSLEDWNNLEDFIGGKDNVDSLKSSYGWEENQYNDDYGFNCFPSGWVDENGEFYQFGGISKFWSSTQNDDGSGKLWSRIVGFKFTSVPVKPENGFSIRMLKK